MGWFSSARAGLARHSAPGAGKASPPRAYGTGNHRRGYRHGHRTPHPSVVIPPLLRLAHVPDPGPSGAASPLLPVDDDVTPAPEVEEEQPALTVEEEQEQLQQLSLDFIKRYILTFDRDRDALAAAYAEDAIVSFRDNNFACPTHSPSSDKGRLAIHKSTMPKLPALQNFRSRPGQGRSTWTTTASCLKASRRADKVMLSVNGELFGINDERRLAIDQTFVLRRNVGNVGVGKSDDAWPLVATSHLMVVRDTRGCVGRGLRWVGLMCRTD
ncbi:hypothetical protein B0H13DRAFT_71863 [Mycena leptocephala]|nr:hypothetical protein B0H13DRAFT_71863 [Mycena leptocephala]